MIDKTKLHRPNADKTSHIAARVNPAVKAELESVCREARITVSALLGAMVLEFLEKERIILNIKDGE